MKQVIEIDSDSEVPNNSARSSEGAPARALEEQLQLSASKIKLYQQSLDKDWWMDARLAGCSQLLRQLSTEQSEEGILTFYLPTTISVEDRYLKLIEIFYSKHKFRREEISIGKITYEGHKKALDPVSLQFLQDCLRKQNFDDVKNLFDLCEFLKFTELKQVIAVYIASQHFFFFNEKTMRQKKEDSDAYFSRQEEINLRLQMKNYAAHLSQDLLQKLHQKYNKQFAKQQGR